MSPGAGMARQVFDQLASSYDAARAIEADGRPNWRASLSRYLPPANGLALLDLGCGTGLFATLLVEC